MTASDQDVMLQQWLYYKQRGTFTMAYHQFWGVLKRESRYGKTRLELYESSQPNSRLALTLPLTDIFHVINREARARSHAFQILGMGTKYHFAARTETECRAWMDAITRVTTGMPEAGVEYEFCVTVMCNQYSTALSLTGNYLLVVSNTHVTLMSSSGMLCSRFNCHLLDLEKVVFANMDCSKQRLSILTLHTISTSAVNKGTFVFQTSSARDIVKVIHERISLLGGQPSSEAKKKEQLSRSMIRKLPVDKTGSLDWKHFPVQEPRKFRTMVQRSASIDAISPVSAESRLPGLSSSSSFLFEDSASSSGEESAPQSTNNVSRSVDDLLMSDSTVARRDFTLQFGECSQNLTPIHQKVPCEDLPVNDEAWLEPTSNAAIREHDDSWAQLTSLPSLPNSSTSSSSSMIPSESDPCQRQSTETASDVFGDELQTENQMDTLGRDPLLDYVNSSAIIQHLQDMQIRKMYSQPHSTESFPSPTSVSSLQLFSKSHHQWGSVPVPRKTHSVQELPAIPTSKYRSVQHCAKAPSQSWSSGQLAATGYGGTLEVTSPQYLDDTRDNLLTGSHPETPEIPTPEKRASTEDLLDKIELWIPEWRKEEYLSAQKKRQEKHHTESPERLLQVSHNFGRVRDRSSDSDDENPPQSPVYLDILADFTTAESPKGTSTPHFSTAPLPNTPTRSKGLTSAQSYPTNFTHPPTTMSSSSPSLADRNPYPETRLSPPLSSKHSPRAKSSSLTNTPTLPLGHPYSSLPLMASSELSSSLDFTQRRAHTCDPVTGPLEYTCSQLFKFESSASQQNSPCHKLSHDLSTSSVKASSESPDSVGSGHATGPDTCMDTNAHVNFRQSSVSRLRSSFSEQGEDSETMGSTHVDEPLYSSIAAATSNPECGLDLSVLSDDDYDRPDEVLALVSPATTGLLPVGEIIDPYCHVSKEQLLILASRPPAVPPCPPPRTSHEKSPSRSKEKNSSTEDYMVYDYPYMSAEARKKMILHMLRKQEEKEEKGVYIEMCKPQVPPRPQNTLPSIHEHRSPEHHHTRLQFYDQNPRSAFDKLPSLPSTPTSPSLHT